MEGTLNVFCRAVDSPAKERERGFSLLTFFCEDHSLFHYFFPFGSVRFGSVRFGFEEERRGEERRGQEMGGEGGQEMAEETGLHQTDFNFVRELHVLGLTFSKF